MSVNGLLITLARDEFLAEQALLAMAGKEGVELGERTGVWQPLVVEVDGGAKGAHTVHEWLEALPGVEMVDVVFTSVGDVRSVNDGGRFADGGGCDTLSDAELPTDEEKI